MKVKLKIQVVSVNNWKSRKLSADEWRVPSISNKMTINISIIRSMYPWHIEQSTSRFPRARVGRAPTRWHRWPISRHNNLPSLNQEENKSRQNLQYCLGPNGIFFVAFFFVYIKRFPNFACVDNVWLSEELLFPWPNFHNCCVTNGYIKELWKFLSVYKAFLLLFIIKYCKRII